jgi:hypothetical protein
MVIPSLEIFTLGSFQEYDDPNVYEVAYEVGTVMEPEIELMPDPNVYDEVEA